MTHDCFYDTAREFNANAVVESDPERPYYDACRTKYFIGTDVNAETQIWKAGDDTASGCLGLEYWKHAFPT